MEWTISNSPSGLLQSWQVKSSLGAIWTQNGPLLSLQAHCDPRISLQFLTITSFIGTVGGGHPQSKVEDGRLGSVRTFHLPGLFNKKAYK